VGVLLEKDKEISLQRVEFRSHWSENYIETNIAGESDSFLVALGFSPSDIAWLSRTEDAVRKPSPEHPVATLVAKGSDLIRDNAARELLSSDDLLTTQFLVVQPQAPKYNHRLFAVKATSATERTIPVMVISYSGEILASTPISLFLPE
jgi:hypothetical protein